MCAAETAPEASGSLRDPDASRRARRAFLMQLVRYTAISAFALAVDFAIYWALVQDGWNATAAGVVAYTVGLAINYILSARHVFSRDSVGKSERRLFAEYAATGLVGLAITAAVIAAATHLAGLGPLTARILAALITFVAVFALRRQVVFA